MEQQLRDYGEVQPIVAGKYGEMNKGALDHALNFAESIAAKNFWELTAAAGVDTPREAAQVVKREIIQLWGCSNVRARARSLLSLLDYVGPEISVLRSQDRRHNMLRRGLRQDEFIRSSSARVPGPPRRGLR